MAASKGKWRQRAIIIATMASALIVAGSYAVGQFQRLSDAPRGVPVRSSPIESFSVSDPSLTRFGALEFRGGLELRSSEKDFGGLSGLLVSPDGNNFVAVSDRGRWFTGRLTYKDGRLAGLSGVVTAPVLGADGASLSSHKRFDTEALARLGDAVFVGVERVNEIYRFDFGKDGVAARAQPVDVPAGVKGLPFNKGIEALVAIPDGQPLAGTLIALSERGLDSAGNIFGFLIGGPKPGTFTVRRFSDFDISDAAMLPDGDVLILERSFSPAKGVAIRLRRVKQADFAPGAVIEGRVIMQADMSHQIDNMEGMAVHRNAQGETIITMVSDDNFSMLQRNLILQFALMPE